MWTGSSVTQGVSVAAAIYRDHIGKFHGASVIVSVGVTDPARVETMACRESLCLANDLHISSAIIACESSMVVHSLSEDSQEMGAIVIKEIRRMIPSGDEFILHHEFRESNVAAHNITRSSLDLCLGRHVQFLEPPNYVNYYVMP